MHLLELVGACPRSARKLDLLLTCGDLGHVARKLAPRAPEIDLESEGILSAGVALDHPLQRRVGHEAAIPVLLALDLDGGKAWWEGAACHDMLRPDRMSGAVEIDEVAGPDIDGPALKRVIPALMRSKSTSRSNVSLSNLYRRQLVAPSVPPGCSQGINGRAEKNPVAPNGAARLALIWLSRLRMWSLRAKSTNGLFDQPQGALEVTCVQNSRSRSNSRIRRIACDNRTIDGSDRDAGDPVRMDVGFRQRLVDASLVCPQRTAALQKQGDALEWETVLMSREVWSKLKVHWVLFC